MSRLSSGACRETKTKHELKRGEPKENVSSDIVAVPHCTFSSLSSSPWPKNQLCCWSEKTQHHWMTSRATYTATFTGNWTSPHMQDERLHYFVSVGHVGDHVGHVVLGRPDQSGTEHQGQVSWLHLGNKDKDCRQETSLPTLWCLVHKVTLFFSELSATFFRWPTRNFSVWK